MLSPDDATPDAVFDAATRDAGGGRGQDTRADPPSAVRRASLPEPGDVIADRYLIEGTLGRGGMGAVFTAIDQHLKRKVAVKVLTSASRHAAARFAREAEVAANAGVRGVVAVHDHGDHLGAPYLVMELVEGQSLDTWVRLGPLEPREAATLVEQVARTLAALHARGVVHRDIKPSNILVGQDGHPRLADFGLARRDADARLTGTGELVGTPLYMAPEFVVGRPSTEQAADIYALGCVAYHAVTGRMPVEAKTFSELLATYARGGAPAPPSTWRPSLPPGWDVVCARALAFDPRERYPAAEALADDLHLLATGRDVRPPGTHRRRRWPIAAALVAFGLAVGGGWVGGRIAEVRSVLGRFREWDGEECAREPGSCWAGQHRLMAFGLGLGDGPMTLGEIERWERELAALGAVHLAADRAALDRARSRLQLHRRLLEHGVGRHDGCGRSAGSQDPASLAVDALLMAAHGQTAQALSRARDAARLDAPGVPLSGVLDHVLAVRADQAPLSGAASALAELANGADAPLTGRPRSLAALERAAARWVDDALAAPDAGARLLRLGADFAAAPPVAREALARAKVAAVEVRAAAWADAIAAGQVDRIERLATLVRASPAVTLGPVATAELDRVTAGAIAAWAATQDPDQGERALELESRLWFEVGHAHRGAPPPLELVLTLIEARYANRMIAREPAFILLGALRACPIFVPREAIRHAQTDTLLRKAGQDRPFLQSLAERAPTQSVEYALALLDLDVDPRPRAAVRVARLQRALETRPADLHPERQGELHEYLAEARLELPDAASLERAVEDAARALSLAQDLERIEAASLLLARAHAARRAPRLALEALEVGVDRLRTAMGTVAATEDEQSSHPNVFARHAAHVALELERVDPPRAVTLAQEVARLASSTPSRLFFHDQEAALAGRLAALLERAGLADDAARLRR